MKRLINFQQDRQRKNRNNIRNKMGDQNNNKGPGTTVHHKLDNFKKLIHFI